MTEPASAQSTDPPETYADYLANATVIAAIGAQSTYQECPTGPYAKILATGDEARSFLDPLSEVVQSGVNVLIWAGDLGAFTPLTQLPGGVKTVTKMLTPCLPRLDLQLVRIAAGCQQRRLRRQRSVPGY